MRQLTSKITWWIFGFLCTAIGIYPFMYFFVDRSFGLLSSKTPELLADTLWNIGFYGHIIFGGMALLSGWSQFSKRIRRRRLAIHRNLGKLYVISVFISSIAGIYIGFFATGGLISASGFILLGLVWFLTTFWAYRAIRNRDIKRHQYWMIFSYAACFAAVTLRLWLPFLTGLFGAFEPAYRLVSWLAWVPNLVVAYWITKNEKLTIPKLRPL